MSSTAPAQLPLPPVPPAKISPTLPLSPIPLAEIPPVLPLSPVSPVEFRPTTSATKGQANKTGKGVGAHGNHQLWYHQSKFASLISSTFLILFYRWECARD